MNGAAGVGGALTAQAINGGQEPEGAGALALPHPFSHSIIEHHNDGSHTMHHVNRKHGYVHAQPHKDGDVRGSAVDHDAMLDHLMDHTGLEEE